MKADQQTQTEVTQVFKGMFEAYKKRDIQGVLSFWAPDPDIIVIGSGGDEKSVGTAQFSEQLKRDWAQGEVQSIGVKNFAVSAASSAAWISADINFHGKTAAREFDLPVRLTGVMEKRGGRWMWVQMHISSPSSVQASGQSWPKA
jgi:ketosteroid isomerase-like protein